MYFVFSWHHSPLSKEMIVADSKFQKIVLLVTKETDCKVLRAEAGKPIRRYLR